MTNYKASDLPGARREAEGGARVGTQTNVSYILARNADAQECASHFLHDPAAPCYDLTSRRTYALAALYVDALMRETNPVCGIDDAMLVVLLRSCLHIRRGTATNIIRALVDAGLLAIAEYSTSGGVADE